MSDRDRQVGKEDNRTSRQDSSLANQQGTTQTGAQNGGGENIDREEDKYTEDLQRSGQRKSREEE